MPHISAIVMRWGAWVALVGIPGTAAAQSPYALIGTGNQAGGPTDWAAGSAPERILARVLEAWERDEGLSGTVLAAYAGGVRLERGYGFASIELGVANTTRTRYPANFFTMQVTAAALGVLSGRGSVDIDAPVEAYLPEAPAAARAVPLRALLTTYSGLEQDLWRYTDKTWKDRFAGFGELMTILAGVDRRAPTGERRAFSGPDGSSTDYLILGAIVEAVAQEPFDEFVQREVLEPLGMRDSGFLTQTRPVARLASPYRSVLGHLEPHPTADYSAMPSAGALYSTARDVYRFVQGVVEEQRLGAATREVVMVSFGVSEAAIVDGALTRDLDDVPDADRLSIIGTNGWILGSTMTLVHFVGRGDTFIVLSNVQSASQIYDLQRRWAHTVFGLPVGLPEPRVARTMWRTLVSEGPEAALEIYRRGRSSGHLADLPLIDAVQGNLRTLRSQLRLPEAIRVGELLVGLDPSRWRAHYELGETRRVAGDEDGARRDFRAALSREPDDPWLRDEMRAFLDGGRR